MIGVASGCHQPRVETAPEPVLAEQHCWWSVFSAPLPLDSVTNRFARAFSDAGLAAASPSRAADTTVVRAKATHLGKYGGAVFAARFVGYQIHDSTHFRYYVAASPEATSAQRIGLCHEIASAAAVGATAPRDPDGEETLPVWSRR
jgi:hypothetical protein